MWYDCCHPLLTYIRSLFKLLKNSLLKCINILSTWTSIKNSMSRVDPSRNL